MKMNGSKGYGAAKTPGRKAAAGAKRPTKFRPCDDCRDPKGCAKTGHCKAG